MINYHNLFNLLFMLFSYTIKKELPGGNWGRGSTVTDGKYLYL